LARAAVRSVSSSIAVVEAISAAKPESAREDGTNGKSTLIIERGAASA
jgi:hypothetical protein